jgi:flagellar basal body-associated protein FliL
VAVDVTKVINLQKQGPRVFLKCTLSIIIRDEEIGKQMTDAKSSYYKSKTESIVLDALSTTLDSDDILEIETREAFAQDVMDRLNDEFRPKPSTDPKAPPRPAKPIKDVLVTDWAVQR